MTTFTARVWFRKGGFDRKSWINIVEGYRAEIVDGLPDGKFIYTGVCETRQEAVNELIAHLQSHGLSGKLKVAA